MTQHTGPELKPLRAVRRFCLDCQGGLPVPVRECADAECALFPWRLAEAIAVHPEYGRVIRGIRRYCFACAGSRAEIRRCDAGDGCSLYPYRFGVAPETYRRVMERIRNPKELWLPGLEQCHHEIGRLRKRSAPPPVSST
jgi:hypothetical protein